MKKRYLIFSFTAALCIVAASFILSACLHGVRDYAEKYAVSLTDKLSVTNLMVKAKQYVENLYILPIYITSAAEASANLDGVYAFDLSTLTTVYDSATEETRITSFRFGRDTVAVYVECSDAELIRFTKKLSDGSCFSSATAEKNLMGGYVVTCSFPENKLKIEGINLKYD